MRLIDADALERVLDMIPCADIKNMDGQAYVLVRLSQVFNIVKNAPTIEPERKKGKWLHVDTEVEENCEYPYGWMPWYCSECGAGVGKHQTAFCPNCGADMRGEEMSRNE